MRRRTPRRTAGQPVATTLRGITLGTGALIAFERNDRRMWARLKEALASGRRLTVPTVVVAETWRGGARSARLASLMDACVVEPLVDLVARAAGESMARVKRATTIDAIVVASAGTRRDVVLTSDPGDLEALAEGVDGVDVVALDTLT